jgi:hypothetical protein
MQSKKVCDKFASEYMRQTDDGSISRMYRYCRRLDLVNANLPL